LILEWTCSTVLVWRNLVTSTNLTAALTQGRSRAPTLITFYDFCDKLRVILSSSCILANIHTLVVLPVCEQMQHEFCSPTTICKDSLANFFNILVSSACGRAATTQLVFNIHFTSFETIKPLVHLFYPRLHPWKLPWALWQFQLQFFPKGIKTSYTLIVL